MTPTKALLRQMLDASPLPICWLDQVGRFLQANTAFRDLAGHHDLEQCRLSAVFSSQGGRSWGESYARIEAGHLVEDRGLIRVGDGAERPVDVTYSWLADGDTRLVCMVISRVYETTPVFDQGQALLENAKDAVYIFDETSTVTYANAVACRLTGYRREELQGMGLETLDPIFPRDKLQEFRLRALHREPLVFETEHRCKDGSRHPVEVSLAAGVYDGKHFTSAFVRDIRQRKKKMREMEELRFALENAADAIYLYGRDGRIRFANQTACETLGYAKVELVGMPVKNLDPAFDTDKHKTLWEQEVLSLAPFMTHHYRKNGESFPVEVLTTASTIGGKECAVAFVRDITERVRTQRALEEGEERFRIIADTSPVALIIFRQADGGIQYMNAQADILFGGGSERPAETSFHTLLRECDVEDELIDTVTRGDELMNHEIQLNRDSELPVWVSVNARAIVLQGERVICCALLDITETKELSNQLSYQATYDDLTGLVNRREFEDRLQEVIELARRNGHANALCYLDLDQFKIINDTCGHMAGDELLRQIAPVLYDNVRDSDTLARLGGDEFAILLEQCTLEDAEHLANRVRQSVQDFRFLWQGKTFNLSVSIGLVPISAEVETVSDVLRRADTACYAAKDTGRNRVHIFHFDDQELAQRHGEMQWVARISHALDNDRLELWKQEIALTDGRQHNAGHFELLVRMRDEEGKLILPGAFLPSAERYDLVSRIDRWVMNAVFDWLASNPEQVETLTCCAVNLSGQTLTDEEFLDLVTRRLRETGVPPSKICFEITETAAIANLTNATRFMTTLKSLGCHFALDDFGSGLSSFAYLKNLPVDYVKIDGFFVQDVATDPVDRAMVKAINDMAHVMGKLTIAEFVEDREILQILVELGVDYVQGYGIARPSPLRAVSPAGLPLV